MKFFRRDDNKSISDLWWHIDNYITLSKTVEIRAGNEMYQKGYVEALMDLRDYLQKYWRGK